MLSDWPAIVPPSEHGARNVRRADKSHPLDFWIARDHRGRYIFELEADSPGGSSPELPKISGLDCELEPAGDHRSRLVLVLHHAADFRNFGLMCNSLMLATEEFQPPQSWAGLLRTVEELHRWQEMLRRRTERLLSKSERIGLVGELLFLRDVLADRFGWSPAIKCWNGPGGHEQDFVVAGSIFEVKTQVVTADRRIRISSEDQLDPVQGRILLCNQGIAPIPPADPASRTLNALVTEIRDATAGAGSGAPELLEIALLEAGYEERPEYDEEAWVLVDRTYYEVTGDFPRIERGDLRPGVEMVKYSIRVSDCVLYTVSEDNAFGGIRGMSELQESYEELRDDIMLEAEARGVFQQEAFFELYAEAASDNGDTIDLEYAHSRREGGSTPYRIDGHGFDADRGTLYLAVCDYRDSLELESLQNDRLTAALKQATNFFKNACSPAFINSIEETSPAFAAAYPIYSARDSIKRLRVILFSNAKLATKRPPQLGETVSGLPVVYSVLDCMRYFDIQKSFRSPEPIEVDLAGVAGSPIACLKASTDTTDYQSYLLAIPGPVLAEIYGLYGARLLEQNVRTYLQARTKVNKGILASIRDTPEMFFAYNNGLTATASSVDLETLPDGQLGIAAIHNLQIVNGGQTTASILYAKDVAKSPLDRVHVQMKLSVVPPELIEQVVPKISRYANTQNRISEADFFSSHPFHLQMERYSRILAAPPQNGALTGEKWFYERARGQYRDGTAYATAAGKKKHLLEFPKDKVIDKTELAKFVLTFQRKPNIVSRGAQKAFMAFADDTAKAWKAAPTQFNETWYRNACAMAQVFRWTDKAIAKSEWYQADRGYKSQTVTYTLAWLAEQAAGRGKAGLDWNQIWNTQAVPEELQDLILALAPQIATAIRQTPDNIRNVGEYCKFDICWQTIAGMTFNVPELPDHLLLDADEAKQERKDARATAKIDTDIDFDVLLHTLVPKAEIVRRTAERRGLLSPKSNMGLQKLGRGNLNLARPERNALKLLVTRMAEEGMSVQDL